MIDILKYVKEHIVTTIGTAGGILGAYMVSCGASLEANWIWLIANPFLLYYSIMTKEVKLAAMYSVYLLFAAKGVYTLS